MLPYVDIYRRDQIDYLLMNTPDHISKSLKNRGSWSDLEITLCQNVLNGTKNKIVIDAGANLGAFTVPVAKFLLPLGGSVVCFEPQRVVFQQLCANVFFNRLDNVYANNLALGDTHQTIEIPELDFHKSKNIGGFSVDPEIRSKIDQQALGTQYENFGEQAQKTYSVQQIELDSLGYFENVAFMKVDIEGLELEFFKGARKTIIENNFPPIVFELWDLDWYLEKAELTKQYLKDLGYSFMQLGTETLAQHPNRYPQMEFVKEGDVLRVVRKDGPEE